MERAAAAAATAADAGAPTAPGVRRLRQPKPRPPGVARRPAARTARSRWASAQAATACARPPAPQRSARPRAAAARAPPARWPLRGRQRPRSARCALARGRRQRRAGCCRRRRSQAPSFEYVRRLGGCHGAGRGRHARPAARASSMKQSSLGAGRGRLGRASQRCSSKRGAPRSALACAGWRCRPKGAAGALLLLTTLPPEASNSGSSLEQWRFMGQRRRAAAACRPSGAGQSMEGTRQAEVASSLAPAQGVRRPKVYGASSCPMRMPQKLGQAGRRPREAGNAGAAAAQQLALHSRARVGRRAKRKHALGTPPPIGVQRHGDGCQPNTSARGGDQQTNAPCQAPCNESDL